MPRAAVLALLASLCGVGLPQQPQHCEGTAQCDSAAGSVDAACGADGEELFTEVPMKGMHILRAVPSSALPHTGVPACPMFELEVYADGMRQLRSPDPLTVRCRDSLASVVTRLKASVRRVREGSPGRDIPPEGSVARHELAANVGFDRWEFYTAHGERAGTAVEGLLRCGSMLAFEGGLFLWPGVRVGYRRTVGSDPLFGDITLITQSLQPLVFLVDPLLSAPECAHIIALTGPILEVR